jgi:Tfp pilus assembly protein PilX
VELYINNQRGGALLITLAIMIMLTIAALIAVDTATTDIDLSFNQLHHDKAFYVAEAGINRAVDKLNDDNAWIIGYANVAFDDGHYWVAVMDSSVNPPLYDTVILRSASIVDQARANIEAWVVPQYKRPFEYALFARDTLQISNNTCTDSYNSDSGSYFATQLNDKGNVGSNGYVSIFNSTSIGGNASSATSGGMYMDREDAVTGDTATGVDPLDMNMIDSSQFSWAETVNMAPAGFTGTYSYNPVYDRLKIDGSQSLVLSGGVYFFNDIEIKTGGSLQVQAGEKVTIYVTGNITLNQSSSLNPGGAAGNVQIYSLGSSLFIGQSAEFRAAFWGPNAEVTIRNNTDVYGGIVGSKVVVDNHACFHYDRSLAQINLGKTGEMEMIAWREM